MQTTALRLVALIIAAFTCCSSLCSAQTVQPNLKLEVIRGVPVVGGVYLNGQGPYRFILDTASQGNEVEAGLAHKLGVTTTRQLEEATPAGITRVQAVTIHEVTLGAAEINAAASAENQEFMLVSGESFHALDSSIRGILGQQFLNHFNYTLDFKRHRLSFGDEVGSGEQVKFRLISGCMAVTTDLGDLLLDSGTESLFLFKQAALGAHTNIVTSNGTEPVGMKRALSVSVSGKRYYPQDVLVKEVAGIAAKGLLPASLFHAIHVSNSAGYLILNPAE